MNKKRTPNGAVLRQAGCNSADSLVGIWKRIARPSGSEPPPAASRRHVSGNARATVRTDTELQKNVRYEE
jgi:hypothetical protein